MMFVFQVYKKEVTLLAGKLTEENNTKSTVIEAKEKEKKTAKSAQPKEAPKSKPEVKQKEDSDIEGWYLVILIFLFYKRQFCLDISCNGDDTASKLDKVPCRQLFHLGEQINCSRL